MSASQFSPDGRVFQIEYAGKAVEISGTAVSLRGKDGCVIAVEKVITSKLHEVDSGSRVFTIEQTIGMVSPLGILLLSLIKPNDQVCNQHFHFS